MNEAMKIAWLEITQMLGEPTQEELHVFLRTWQKAMQAEREACAKVCDVLAMHPEYASEVTKLAAMAIRARGQV